MPFEMMPVEAYIIDISGVEDIERERLKVTFANGKELFFGVQLVNKIASPWLILDTHSGGMGTGLGDANELFENLSKRFYRERVVRSKKRIVSDWFRSTWNSNYRFSYAGWTQERVKQELSIEMLIGSHFVPSSLCVGRLLEVVYNTRYSTPGRETIPWGYVESIEPYSIQPASVVFANVA